jgi:hypothetical protein
MFGHRPPQWLVEKWAREEHWIVLVLFLLFGVLFLGFAVWLVIDDWTKGIP